MKRIIVASENQVKINAARVGFETVYDELCVLNGIKVDSGVGKQPVTDQDTLNGAMARAIAAKEAVSDAEFWVGMEGGVESAEGELQSFAWIVIVDRSSLVGKARTGTLYLPQKVSELIQAGKELGEADDIVFGERDSKKTIGAVGLLTRGIIDREKLYAHAVVLALVPFLNSELY